MDNQVLKRTAEKLGLNRVKYVDNNVPTQSSDIYFLPFFGDYRYSFILSSFLLKQYITNKYKKYVILCSWPGYQSLFPYVDEFWTVNDSNNIKNLALGIKNYDNEAEISNIILRKANEHFENVLTYKDDFVSLYKDGFQKDYWDSFKELKYYLPGISSETLVSESVRYQVSKKVGKKILIHPTTVMRSWQNIHNVNLSVPYEFWIDLCEKLVKNNYVPVVYQNYLTYDLSKDLFDKCIFHQANDFVSVLPLIRMTDCVLDLYSGISRFAMIARIPFLGVDERLRYVQEKDSEIDMLCCQDEFYRYIFSYSSMISTGDKSNWDINIINCILKKLEDFLPKSSGSDAQESEKLLNYDKIKLHKKKKCAIKFISSSKNS